MVSEGPVASVGTTNTTDIDVILGAGIEAREGQRIVVDVAEEGTSAKDEASRTVLNLVEHSRSGVPSDVGVVDTDAGRGNVAQGEMYSTVSSSR